MLFTRLAVLGFAFLSSFGNKPSPKSPTAPQTIPQASAILQSMAAATGWNAANLPKDVLAIGTITIEDAVSPETLPVTLSAKSCRLFRNDVQFSDGTHSTIVNQDSAAAIAPGAQQLLPPFTALSANSYELPFFCLPSALASGSLNLVGIESVTGQSAYRIDVSPVVSSSDALAIPRQIAAQFTVWISTSSGMPLELSSKLVSPYNSGASVSVLRVFSDFRVVNGIAVPFQQQQFVQGQLRSTLQLSSVVFNAGVSDSSFSIPMTQ